LFVWHVDLLSIRPVRKLNSPEELFLGINLKAGLLDHLQRLARRLQLEFRRSANPSRGNIRPGLSPSACKELLA
jgi:hypothetical protein